MAGFIINPASTSFKEIKRDLLVWIQTLPNYQQYRTFYQDEAGQIITDLISGFSSYNTFNAITATRESYLNYANNRASTIGASSILSYSPFRGSNERFFLNVYATRTVLLNKYQPCGNVAGVDISPVREYTLIAGQTQQIECILGEVLEEKITIENDSLKIFVFAVDSVSEDLKLQLNGIEVPVEKDVRKLIKDFWYVQSNAFGAVDVYYLNKSVPGGLPLYPYTTNDELKLTYIKLKNYIYSFPLDVIFDYGDILSGPTDDPLGLTGKRADYPFRSYETRESIKIKAPLAFEVQKTIRGREDFPKYFKTLRAEFVDTNSTDVNLPVIYLDQKRMIPAFTDVTYINEDDSLLNSQQIIDLEAKLNSTEVRAHGIPESKIIHSKLVLLDLDIKLRQRDKTNNATYISDINAILKYELDDRGIYVNREQKLQYQFSLEKLEYALERLSYVLTARVNIKKVDWHVNTNFKRGQFVLPITPNGKMYFVISQTYNNLMVNTGITSSLVEPAWETIDDKLTFENIPKWIQGTYNVGDLVIPSVNTNTVFKVKKVTLGGNSGAIEPLWGTIINEITEDNELQWQCVNPSEITNKLIYKTYPLEAVKFQCVWNEYFKFSYNQSSSAVWV